ncbi:MAG: exo-alpha-sialidase [Thermoplasmatota archaeon]
MYTKQAKIVAVLTVTAAMLCVPIAQSFQGAEPVWSLTATMDREPVAAPNPVTDPATTASCNGDIQLSSAGEDDEHPTVIRAADGSYVAAWERQLGALEGHIYFMRSTDGSSWSELFNTNTGDMASNLQNWPVLVSPPGGDVMYGAWNDRTAQSIYVMYAPDPADPGTWEIGALDHSGYDSERSSFSGAAMSDTTWGWAYVGHVEYAGYDLPSAIEAEFQLGAWEEAVFSWTGDQFFPLSYNADMAATPNHFWQTWDYENETSGGHGIGIHWGDPNEEGDMALWPVKTWEGNDPYMDPAIGASGSNLCVVYMSQNPTFGDWDLSCKYSSNEGETWQDGTFPAESQVDDMHPEIFMSGSSVYCAFIRDGNLYLAKSTDGGATWEEPEQINDEDGTVVEEPSSLKVSQGGIVWTDNRNGNRDIYYEPLPAPNLGIDSVGGGVGVTATVSNTGTAPAENVGWTIDLSGPVFLGNHAEGTIDTLASGDTTTISTGLVFGIGPTTISIEAGGATGSASGFVLGPLVLGL